MYDLDPLHAHIYLKRNQNCNVRINYLTSAQGRGNYTALRKYCPHILSMYNEFTPLIRGFRMALIGSLI